MTPTTQARLPHEDTLADRVTQNLRRSGHLFTLAEQEQADCEPCAFDSTRTGFERTRSVPKSGGNAHK